MQALLNPAALHIEVVFLVAPLIAWVCHCGLWWIETQRCYTLWVDRDLQWTKLFTLVGVSAREAPVLTFNCYPFTPSSSVVNASELAFSAHNSAALQHSKRYAMQWIRDLVEVGSAVQ